MLRPSSLVTLCSACLALLPVAPAQADELEDAPVPQRPQWQLAVEPALVTATPGLGPATPGVRTMLWSGRGAWRMGVGVEQAWPTPPGPFTGPAPQPRVLLGASMDTGEHLALGWRAPLPAAQAREALQPARTMEFSLVLKPSDRLAELRRGALMRLELSGQTQLSLRPRGGGRINLQLTSRW